MTMARQSAWEKVNRRAEAAVLAGLLIFMSFGIYEWLDGQGYVPHTVEATIQAQQNWLVGESKDCASSTLDSNGAARQNKSVGYALAFVLCDGGPNHAMNITFYGREEQPEYEVVTWRCARQAGSFTCWQSGGR